MDLQGLLDYGKYQMPYADLELLYSTSDEIKARLIMEVGSARGCSSIALGTVAKKYDGEMQCVEYRNIPEWHVNIAHYDLTDIVRLINKPSPWVDSHEINYPLDYFFIDGCHSYLAALVDFYWGYHYVRQGGLIAFHDYHSPHNEVMPAINRILESRIPIEELARSVSGKGLIVFKKKGKYAIKA